MEWKKAIEKSSDYKGATYEVPNRWLYVHYYEALNILFRVENALRVFVYTILKNNYLDKWADTKIETAEEQETTISAVAKKRIKQAQDFGYLGYEISSPLMHLNSGELVRLITSETYWKHFAKHFKGRKEIIKNKLDEIGSIRNALAHFRPIKEDDVEIIKQNAKHALVAVEACLLDMTSTITVVPTNTTEPWYQKLSILGAKSVNIGLYQSTSTEWIRLQILYKCHQINVSRYSDDWLSYQILNLKTPNIIDLYPGISKYVTYISEEVPYTQMPEDWKPTFQKNISLVFFKDVLNTHLDEILRSLQDLIKKITNEEELVTSDHLARGRIIEPASVSASLKKDGENPRWEIRTYSMLYPFTEDHPVEYWGDIGPYYGDFIAGTTKYPWMPSDISRFDFGF
jgi:hypothetical protein